jgi:hypothetical protein
MKPLQIIAMVLAGAIGIMSVISGSLVFFGLREVGYTVLNGLVAYNVAVGALSIITAYLIWKNFMLSKKLISLILILHASVLAYLYFFSETVAMESIMAMTFRVGIWILIFILLHPWQSKKQKTIK